jgi:hypothetical protein
MSRLEKLKTRLHSLYNFLSSVNPNYKKDSFISHFCFLAFEVIPFKQPDCLVIIIRHTYGYGDLHNICKTTILLEKIFTKSKIFLVPEQRIDEKTVRVCREYYLEHLITSNYILKSFLQKNMKCVIIESALPNGYHYDLPYIGHILVDEYNGWRLFNKYSVECVECKGFEKNQLKMSGGIGFTKNFPCVGMHFYKLEKHLEDKTVPLRQPYYFAYNSDPGDSHSFRHLQRYINTILIYEENNSVIFRFIILGVSRKRLSTVFTLDEDCNIHYKNKIIPVILYDTLSHKEVMDNIKNSNEPVFITGDQSMAEAIHYNKLFFYQRHEWKVEFYKNLCEFFNHICKTKKRKRDILDKHPFVAFMENNIGDGSFFPRRGGDRLCEKSAKELAHLLSTYREDIMTAKKICYTELKKLYNIEFYIKNVIQQFFYVGSEKILCEFLTEIMSDCDKKKLHLLRKEIRSMELA